MPHFSTAGQASSAENFAIFTFWISTKRTTQTVAKCNLEGRQLFVNVDFVEGNHGVGEKLPALGNRSVREVLAHIEKPLREPPTPTKPPRSPEKDAPGGTR